VLDVVLLPGCLDGVLVVVLPDEGNGLIRRYPVDDGETGQRGTGPSPATVAGDLDAFARGVLPCLVQELACPRPVAG
jgi:hypothetical protein